MLNSYFKELVPVELPFASRRKYMHTFDTDNFLMADGYEDYQGIVRGLCESVGFKGIAHMTVDEKIVARGQSHRRSGAHVDGRFIVEENYWGHPGGGWLHYCNNIERSSRPRMAVIVAASHPGCVVYPGIFDGAPKDDGDLEHIREQFTESVLLPACRGYWLSPDCVHESIIYPRPTPRTFLRIALEQ